ncbi:MAG: hypothetical protein PF961_17560 [Planctomycetota bacterium]|nr:hypothetical protein [Planctomycetota bacterium]
MALREEVWRRLGVAGWKYRVVGNAGECWIGPAMRMMSGLFNVVGVGRDVEKYINASDGWAVIEDKLNLM